MTSSQSSFALMNGKTLKTLREQTLSEEQNRASVSETSHELPSELSITAQKMCAPSIEEIYKRIETIVDKIERAVKTVILEMISFVDRFIDRSI